MSNLLKYTFVVHAIICVILGLLLLIVPGRLLGFVGWAASEPILSRILGAALLGLAWGDFRGFRASNPAELTVLIEVDLAFCVLAAIGILRHLVVASYPLIVWLVFAVFVLFAAAWAWARFRKPA